MTRSQRILKLGNLGENVLGNFCIRNNKNVVMSESQYDKVKDMYIDGVEAEVKTLTRIINKSSFFLANNQLNKCLNVERLFFVEIPLYDDFPIDIFESTKPRKTVPHSFNGTDGLLCPLTNMKFVGSIDNRDIIREMKELTPSTYHNDPEKKDRLWAERLKLISNLPRSVI